MKMPESLYKQKDSGILTNISILIGKKNAILRKIYQKFTKPLSDFYISGIIKISGYFWHGRIRQRRYEGEEVRWKLF